MVLQQTKTIGMLTPEITNPYFPELIVAAEDEMRRQGYTSVLANVKESLPSSEAIAESLIDYGVDALLTACARPDDLFITRLRKAGVPVVLVNRAHPALTDSMVVPDYEAGGAMVARHLLALGHERIAYIAGPSRLEPSDARLRGHLRELSKAGADYSRIAHVEKLSIEAGHRAALELLQTGSPPTAIAVANDFCALGVLAALPELGMRAPDDVAVVGYDDIWVSSLPSIRLTSVTTHTARMGELAVRMAIDLIDRGAVSAEPIILEPELRIRQSTVAD
ncbi:substrate-binding domain-containing protein [Microbacterium soli]|uniref:LacI family DNA-binding transcriptional regulator n=1 Tax=Microbacterium soli TaxID=446075 RepID=A0ABP7MXW0_9MICO